MAYGLDPYAISFSFGGLKHSIFLPYFTIICIFNVNQNQVISMYVCFNFYVPILFGDPEACFYSVFQKI